MLATSPLILTDFLRGEFGFQGVTIADAIGMKGFQKNGPAEEKGQAVPQVSVPPSSVSGKPVSGVSRFKDDPPS